MEPVNRSTFMMLGLLALAGLGADQPPLQPATTAPLASTPASPPSSGQQERGIRHHGNRDKPNAAVSSVDRYAVLKTRSIFVKGNQTIVGDVVPGRSNDSSPLSGKASSSLVFNGVIMLGDEANALIEDMGSNSVSMVKAGDLIAAGKVSAITFDDLTYEANGQQKHVSLGQNMDGVVPSAAVGTASSPAASTGSDTGSGSAPPVGPAAAPAPPPGSGGSPEDILARMRAKRNQELGIK